MIAVVYVVIQFGRSMFVIVVVRGQRPALGVLARVGVELPGGGRRCCPARSSTATRAPDYGRWPSRSRLVGAAIGFATPFIGRSATSDWTIDGGHFAERCQAFVLIALGESIIVTGATLSGLLGSSHPDGSRYVAFLVAFLGSVALWWIYFDRAASDSALVIDSSEDPGRLGRNAFHWVHPLIIAGIIVSAAADEVVLHEPSAHGVMTTSWLVVGGTALFLGGHAVFKAIVWRLVSWPRVIAVGVLLMLLLLAPHVSALTLSIATLVVVIVVAVADRLQHPAALDEVSSK